MTLIIILFKGCCINFKKCFNIIFEFLPDLANVFDYIHSVLNPEFIDYIEEDSGIEVLHELCEMLRYNF